MAASPGWERRGPKARPGGRHALTLALQWAAVFLVTQLVVRQWRPMERPRGTEELHWEPAQRGEAAWLPTLPSAAAQRAAASAASCPLPPGHMDWEAMPADPDMGKAAVFTPYNIVFGGGERYLLTVVSVMQEMGYHVDVLTFPTNVCKTKEQLLEVAEGLRVPLRADRVSLHTVTRQGINLQVPAGAAYSLFMLLGNDKLPFLAGVGHVNFYMCQFPFDLKRKVLPGTTKAFATYDYILLNSEFTDRWYANGTARSAYNALRMHGAAPQVTVLHPPVEPFTNAVAEVGGGAAAPQRRDILLLGRFFVGRQSKGHASAIHLFEELLPDLPPGTQLHLVGNLMPGHEEYLDELKMRAEGLPVRFHVSVPTEEILEVLQSTLVQWHLTGIELEPGADVASEEHFGISVAEGMSAGVIPVVLNRGGVGDIVVNGSNGFLAPGPADIVSLTRHVFGLSDAERRRLRSAAVSWVQRFSPKAFARRFRVLAQRGRLTKPFRHLIRQTGGLVLSRGFRVPPRAPNAIVIIEPRQHYAFEYVVKNALHHLGPAWGLHVFHGAANEWYVRHALANVTGAQFHAVDSVGIDIPSLNRLLTSPGFWSGLAVAGVQRVLFLQTDSLLVHGRIGPFMQYDYVGAPWHLQNERWGPARRAMPQGVGNGGLSLRSVTAMLELSRQVAGTDDEGTGSQGEPQQEDFLFSQLMESAGGRYALAPRAAAYAFCIEVPCADLEAGSGGKGGAASRPTAIPTGTLSISDGGEGSDAGLRLQTLPAAPMALHAAWYYLNGTPQRRADLLTLLEASVCGTPGDADADAGDAELEAETEATAAAFE